MMLVIKSYFKQKAKKKILNFIFLAIKPFIIPILILLLFLTLVNSKFIVCINALFYVCNFN